MNFIIDKENKKIRVSKEFNAPLENVWAAWTQPEILDLWWAPKPWKAITKSMDFTEGGTWQYAMVGPDEAETCCRADYKHIEHLKSFSGLDAFCDDEGFVNEEFPRSAWNTVFTADGERTIVNIEIEYDETDDLEQIIELGFKEGFTEALQNLDEYFDSKTPK